MATNRVLQPAEFLTSGGYNLTCFGHFVNLVFNLLKKVTKSLLFGVRMY